MILKSRDNKPMGVIFKRGAYWIDYRANGRRHRKKIGPYKALAEQALSKIEVQIAENKFLDIKREQKIKFEVFADKYLQVYCKSNHASGGIYAKVCLKPLKRHFTGKYLHEITPMAIEKYKTERLLVVKASTTNRELANLKALFNRAIEWEDFNGLNPVKKVKFLREENNRIRYLEKEEISRLIACCRYIIKPLVTVAVFTGMRRGELFNLKWNDINFNIGVIYLLKTKSGKKREIPMNEYVKNALVGVRKHHNSPYVFYRRNGGALKDVRRGFTAALQRAGIKNFRFHDLRHTFASQLVMNGTDIVTVQNLLGHSDIKTTLIYAHLSQDHKQRAVDNLGKRMDINWTPPQQVTLSPQELVSANN